MKKKQKNLYKYLLSICLYAVLSTNLLLLANREITALSPAQLEDSLSISKEEIAIDQALSTGVTLSKDIHTHMDSADNTIKVRGSSSSRPVAISQVADTTVTRENAALQASAGIADHQTPTTTDQTIPVYIPKGPQAGLPTSIAKSFDDQDELIEFQFEDADLQNLIMQIQELFNVTFLSDDMISPLPKGAKTVKGNKISFKTNRPLTKRQAWDLFVTFMGIADFAIVPQQELNYYRIVSTAAAQRSPITTYIGIQPHKLPDSDDIVRYLYFIENVSLETLKNIINSLRSPVSSFITLDDLNAFVLTDKAYNIKSLMNIVAELDRITLPQSMSVIKLRRADAQDVKKLYDSIIQGDQSNITSRLLPARKSNILYFSDNVRLIAEPRTNALIVLGPQDGITKIEDFILKHIDVELGQETFSPLRVYQLKYADAIGVAKLMNDMVQFGKNTPVGKAGGVRDGDKYLKSMTFIPEPDTNSIVVRGDEEDWLKVKEIIANIDTPQPQVEIEILILTVQLTDRRELGSQIRTKTPGGTAGLTGDNVKYQTSGIAFGAAPSSFVVNQNGPGVDRLLGDLVNLVTPTTSSISPGNTVVTLGSDPFGVWGIFNILQKITNTQVVSNPFLLATNKQKAHAEVGEIRRVVSSNVVTSSANQPSFSDNKAALIIDVTPQINSDGMIMLDLDVNINEFTNPNDPASATQIKREIKTTTVVADKEVLALGGLVRTEVTTNISKVPILGDIPLLGWLFKNKQKSVINRSLLVLISSKIVAPESDHGIATLTKERVNDYYSSLQELNDPTEKRDPINRAFFAKAPDTTEEIVEDFLFERNKVSLKKARKERRIAKSKQQKPDVVAEPAQSAAITTASTQPQELPDKTVSQTPTTRRTISTQLPQISGAKA